ncbi:MAG: Crp/Fnr family transcriptional regulator [Rubrivivax sp.]|nr:Crp/Fnr family transcriptional regulator [Rubrivivax sp.]
MNPMTMPLAAGAQAEWRRAQARVHGLDLPPSALAHLLGEPAFHAPGSQGATGSPTPAPYPLVRVAEETPLFLEGAPARSIYVVQAGNFKTVLTGEDGYEHVLDFVTRHDVLGCDGLADGHYASGAVALEESWVFALPAVDLPHLGSQWPQFHARWQAAMARQLARAGEKTWLMATVGAEKRTARFILLHARRMAEAGQSTRRLHLRMGRRDIASHLGLAHESVSRSFSMLADMGLLRVDNRDIEIVDSEALHNFALCTRGYPEAAPRRRASAP